MKKLFFMVALVAACCITSGAKDKGSSVNIKFVEYDLPNGLHVILQQDNSTPNVFVSLMYHVGSKNEDPKNTGFAHFFEHLMFEGSPNIARGEYFKIIQGSGGMLNANTSQDRTYYFEGMPSNQLELALWTESERMLQAKIDTIGVNTQKSVVIEERKQTYETQPYGTVREEMTKRAYTVYPYAWQPIGDPKHIRNSTFDDIYNFYKTFYVPNNAVLVIAGDFNEKQAKDLVEKYFAGIPKGTRPIYRPTVVEPPQKAEIRDVVYDKIQLPGVFMGYHGPAMGTKDGYALEILSKILSGSRSARMRTNITEKGLAAEAGFAPNLQENPGLIFAVIIAKVGQKAEEAETLLDKELERVQTDLVSEDEFQMAMAAKEFEVAASMGSLEDVAEALANNYTYFKDAGRINRELSFYSDLTREDLLNVAKKYLTKNNRVVLYYLPMSEKK